MRARSIRARLTIALSAATAVGILAFAVLGLVVLSAALESRAADRLETAGARFAATLSTGDGFDVTPATLRGAVATDQGLVLLADDAVVAVAGVTPGAVDDLVQVAADGVVERYDADHLVIGVPVPTGGLTFVDGGVATGIDEVVIVADTSDSAATVRTVVAATSVGAAATIAVLIALASLIVGRGLRPLREMADRAEAVAGGDRSTRLPESDADPVIARLARTVNSALDAQQDGENRMRAFVADASHELRTPLTAATGWVDLYLQGGLDDPERRDAAMQRVEDQLGRMRSLVDELGTLARTDAGRPLDEHPVDLTAIAAGVVADARVVAPDRRIDLVADGPVMVLGDAARLAQVARNLVGNAVRHTPADATVEVRVAPGAGRHTLVVADTGPGIPPEALPHVFERFWRGDPSRSRDSGGSGLGLAIVQSLVAAHGGTVRVRSATGDGTVFTVELPPLPSPDDATPGGDPEGADGGG